MRAAERRLSAVARLLGFALSAAVSSFVMLFVSYVLLLTAFMEYAPVGPPIEPSWIGTTAGFGSIALSSCVASVLFTDSRQTSWSSNLLLGSASGEIVGSTWMAIHLLNGDPFSAYDPWSHFLLLPTIGAIGSLIGFTIRRLASRRNPYF